MVQEITFVKCSPSNNMTILVMSELAADQYAQVAAEMMAYGHIHAEQVGFVGLPSQPGSMASLHMAGGEFCGNAALALAACLASQRHLQEGDPWELSLEVSSAEQPVICRVEKVDSDYVCEAAMPLPRSIEHVALSFEGRQLELGIVRYRDFFHLIIDRDRCGIDRAAAERLARLLGVISEGNLVGVMLYSVDPCELAPLIYLPSLDSLIWEQGCGSGTASLGSYLAWRQGRSVTLDVAQPGGTIEAAAVWNGDRISSVRIKCRVGIVASGTAYVRPSLLLHSLSGGIL
ncbi:diaminopimelate epimerase [Paenibacillus sp. 1P07SE]|uniref:diaminopimelate epimerase n=1 Tax=Paenibacillus sp. 1P07SE TaxID=3132209 RepID=UPI0039A598DF